MVVVGLRSMVDGVASSTQVGVVTVRVGLALVCVVVYR